jgi:hypothetical protein
MLTYIPTNIENVYQVKTELNGLKVIPYYVYRSDTVIQRLPPRKWREVAKIYNSKMV